jgi:hypothetical protein
MYATTTTAVNELTKKPHEFRHHDKSKRKRKKRKKMVSDVNNI